MSEVTGISRTSIQRILKHYKWHPYKIQLLHELNEDDHDRRLQFCEIIFYPRLHDVSSPYLVPYLREQPGHMFQQDNARPHIARVSLNFLEAADVTLYLGLLGISTYRQLNMFGTWLWPWKEYEILKVEQT
nr:unnamed protein product [Callosobruchus chinensis]